MGNETSNERKQGILPRRETASSTMRKKMSCSGTLVPAILLLGLIVNFHQLDAKPHGHIHNRKQGKESHLRDRHACVVDLHRPSSP